MHQLTPPPIRPYFESLRCALCGFRDAVVTERNLKLFIAGVLGSLFIGALLHIPVWQWLALLFSGGVFLSTELMNTALEHFTDAFDTHSKKQQDIHFDAIKATKDIAAASALVTALMWGIVTLVILVPHAWALL